MAAADSDEDLRSVFGSEDFQVAVAETGFRKPLSMLVMSDRPVLVNTLKAHILLRVKPELDQFGEGLRLCGVRDGAIRYPKLMAPRFTYVEVDLNTGV